MPLTTDGYNATYGNETNKLMTSRGGVIVTSFSDTADLSSVGLECWALTSGTLKVTGMDGEAVTFLAADLTALNNRIPFAVKRIWSTGTTVTRVLCVV